MVQILLGKHIDVSSSSRVALTPCLIVPPMAGSACWSLLCVKVRIPSDVLRTLLPSQRMWTCNLSLPQRRDCSGFQGLG